MGEIRSAPRMREQSPWRSRALRRLRPCAGESLGESGSFRRGRTAVRVRRPPGGGGRSRAGGGIHLTRPPPYTPPHFPSTRGRGDRRHGTRPVSERPRKARLLSSNLTNYGASPSSSERPTTYSDGGANPCTPGQLSASGLRMASTSFARALAAGLTSLETTCAACISRNCKKTSPSATARCASGVISTSP